MAALGLLIDLDMDDDTVHSERPSARPSSILDSQENIRKELAALSLAVPASAAANGSGSSFNGSTLPFATTTSTAPLSSSLRLDATQGAYPSEVNIFQNCQSFAHCCTGQSGTSTALRQPSPHLIDLGSGADSSAVQQQFETLQIQLQRSLSPARGPIHAQAREEVLEWEKPFYRRDVVRRRMADTDFGRNGEYGRRGPGGPGGGYNNRKRRYRDNDDYDRRPQRRKFEEPLSVRIRKQILGIAESALRDPGEEISSIAKTIVENASDEIFINSTLGLVLRLVQEQPLKIPFIGAVVLHTRQSQSPFCQTVIAQVRETLKKNIENGEWRQVKLWLRFLACLQPIFNDNGVFNFLDELFNRAADLQSDSPDDALGLELVKIILLTIPYAVLVDPKTNAQALDLLSKTDIIASAPREIESIVQPFIANKGREMTPCQNIITLLQSQLQTEAENGWPLTCLPRLYTPNEDLIDLEADTRLKFPSILISQPVNPGPRPLFPQLYISMYGDQEVDSVPPVTNIASSLIRDTLVDTINILDFNRTVAARCLIDVDSYWAPNTFVKRATPYDQLKELDQSKPTWKSEDCAVDAMFSQMLQLPAPEHKLVYYHSMVTETCKIAPAAIAPSLGRVIRSLYRNLEVLDVELSYRFLDWFAHHLSNFDFRWKWTEWTEDIELPNLHPRKAFMLGVLDKEVRLSFAKRIRETLPDPYQPLIPATKDNDIPEFKYNNEVAPHSALAKKMVSLLRKKASESEIQETFDAIVAEAVADSTDTPSRPPALNATEVYMTSICYIGSKSLSHVLSYIERCKERLIALSQGNMMSVAEGEDAKQLQPSADEQRGQIIDSVLNYWSIVAPGVAVNIVDKLLNYTILTPASVVEWALSAERIDGGRILSETWVFEMVERTVGKVAGRVRQIVDARRGGATRARLPPHQVEVLDKALMEEREGMRSLFVIVEDALAGIVDGSNAQIADGDIPEEQISELRAWAIRWRRAFTRKLAVEESIVLEAIKTFPAPADPLAPSSAIAGGAGTLDGRAGVDAIGASASSDAVGAANGLDGNGLPPTSNANGNDSPDAEVAMAE